jgi:diacylglycerol kinase (CTP)
MKHLGRKLFHLLGGLGLLALYALLGREQALWSYTVLAGIVLLLEIARLRSPAFNRMLFARFGSFIRKSEERRMTGTVPYLLGVGLALLFYRVEIAAAAVCFLTFGDVAATAVGERFGRTKIAGEKSLEGTLAFIAAATASGLLLAVVDIHLMRGIILAGALTAAFAELLPLPLNDNLVIPLASGGVMELIARSTGCS